MLSKYTKILFSMDCRYLKAYNNILTIKFKTLILKFILIIALIIKFITFNDNQKSDHLNIKEMQDFINLNLNMDLIDSNYKPHKSLNPKISVIIFNL